MRVNPLCIAVLAIAETAVILGAQELPANDAARQDHARVEREDIRYPKHVSVMKGRGRIYNARLSEETNEDSAMSYRHDDRFRHYKQMKKFPSFTSESNSEGTDKRPKNQWGYIAQEINSLTKQTEKSEKIDQNKAKPGYSEYETTLAPVTTYLNPTRSINKHHRPKAESSLGEKNVDCPSNVDTVFVCTKCRAHYTVKMNIKESKCSSCNGATQQLSPMPQPPSLGDPQAAIANIRDRLETRMRKKIYQQSQQKELDRMNNPYLEQK